MYCRRGAVRAGFGGPGRTGVRGCDCEV